MIRLSFFFLVIVGLFPVAAFSRDPLSSDAPIDCEAAKHKVLADLNKLHQSNEEVMAQCINNSTTPANNDHSHSKGGVGDCQLTFKAVRHHTKGIDQELGSACRLVNEAKSLSTACKTSGQSDCMKRPAEKFREASGSLRGAVNLLRRGRERLRERMDNNKDTALQYSKFLMSVANSIDRERAERIRNGIPDDGNYELGDVVADANSIYNNPSPSDILKLSGLPMNSAKIRKTASDISGAFRDKGADAELDKYSSEQYSAYLQGERFIKSSGALEKKLYFFSSKLDSKATSTVSRGETLGKISDSTISGSTPPTLSSKSGGAAGADFFGATGGSDSADSDENAPPVYAKPLPPDPDDNELYDTLDGKPLSAKVLEQRYGSEESEGAKAAKSSEQKIEKEKVVFESATSSLVGSAFAESSVGANRSPASVASPSQKPFLASSGIAVSGDIEKSKSKNLQVGKEPSDEALSAYPIGLSKGIGKNGPNLRDLLREKLSASAGNGTTRAMHEVLGGMKELSGESAEIANSASAGKEFQNSIDDIRGIDSEPLFMRVKAAHLRFQKMKADSKNGFGV